MSATTFSKFAYDTASLPKQLFGYNVVEFLGEGAGSHIKSRSEYLGTRMQVSPCSPKPQTQPCRNSS